MSDISESLLRRALSTGRFDQSGGDGRQGSHRKANEFTGELLGVMDPTFTRGEVAVITDNDLLALDLYGFEVGTAMTVPRFEGSLEGDVLSLEGEIAGGGLRSNAVVLDL